MNDTETQAKYVEAEGQPTPRDWPERTTPAGSESATKAKSSWMIRHSRVAVTLTAVAFALRWRLNLARIRLAPEGSVSRDHAERELAAVTRRRGSWHST